MGHSVEETVKDEISKHKICIYGKGTKSAPKCGFTVETLQFFSKYGYPFEIIDVLEDMEKRNYLTQMTNWPTLPKVFINGKFYGDTDILEPMEKKGELQALLKEAFEGGAQSSSSGS